MSDRICAFIVTLETDTKEGWPDTDGIKNALLHVKGVIAVDDVVADYNTTVATNRARKEIMDKVLKAINL